MWYIFGGIVAVLIIAAVIWAVKVIRATDVWP